MYCMILYYIKTKINDLQAKASHGSPPIDGERAACNHGRFVAQQPTHGHCHVLHRGKSSQRYLLLHDLQGIRIPLFQGQFCQHFELKRKKNRIIVEERNRKKKEVRETAI